MRKPKHKEKEKVLTGVGWYRPEQWQRLLEISVDVDQLEKTHAEWLAFAEKTVKDLERLGVSIIKVDVDVEELQIWSRQQGLPIDGKARAQFISNKAQQVGKTLG
ncbi:MAG TPA: hypothetical protein VKO18_20270 [Terriglobia bacterium]|nr:hypothetical protein [Terriglobia bacterium]